ncbi:3'-5' exonuclease [Pseudolabrys sp. FHR47]|uniref:3'-5' exonuclease n=1 Tax=Pseudolabrys sp. FHR47 TaxID=2562284 RepID=UPI001FEF5380|nr:3'-5' exonuclease [Pseudolabrys sp. FHR47]
MEQELSLDATEMVRLLEATGDYRVLRRLKPRNICTRVEGDTQTKIAIILDVETTGLDAATDEVIELGMVKLSYFPDGQIAGVIDRFTSFNEPSKPIPEDVSAITRITSEMVIGHRIESEKVSSFISDAAIIVAHNAQFDREFAERYWLEFRSKPWACSATQIDWRSQGYEGSRLGYLLSEIGLFHTAHRAIDDCDALLEVLAAKLPKTGRPAFGALLEQARRKTIRIWAEGAAFDFKEELKRRRYRWNDGSDGRPKSWYIDVDENLYDSEVEYLRTKIYGRDVVPYVERFDAMTRFSNRSLKS